MTNYLLKPLDEYFREVYLLDARLHFIKAAFDKYEADIVAEGRIITRLISSIVLYRDMTFPASFTGANTFVPDYSYELTIEQLPKEVEIVCSQLFCLIFSQGYEVFETFLINIITEYLLYNQEIGAASNFWKEGKVLSRTEIRIIVKRGENKRKNNAGLIDIIRKNTTLYSKHENANCFGFNCSKYFELISEIRHVLVHGRQVVNKRFLNYLDGKAAGELFGRQFEMRNSGDSPIIFLTREKTIDIMCWLSSFAYFLFKCLSVQSNLSTQVKQYRSV